MIKSAEEIEKMRVAGKLAAQVLVESIVRLLPGTLGHRESGEMESFNNDLLEYPQYTKPAEWKGQKIPDILLSGHHQNIAKWRMDQAKTKTQKHRPDLWKVWNKSKD